jgi:hypothetical protein
MTEVEYRVVRDDNGRTVGIGTTEHLSKAHEDAAAWERDGYPVTIQHRTCGPWTTDTEHPDEKFPFTTPVGSDASMFIQWKGTDVCLDFHCPCGADGHFDGYFAYHLRCPACGAVYQLGTQVIAKRLELPYGAVPPASTQTLEVD